jgi:hypothetical protein
MSHDFTAFTPPAYLQQAASAPQGMPATQPLPTIVPATAGWTVEKLEQEVRAGGRFVIFDWNFSILVMSFQRHTDLQWVGRGADGSGRATLWTLISMVVGWWGLPWGVIFTFSTMYHNALGGRDVTAAVLDQVVGPTRSAILLSQSQPRHVGAGLWALRIGLLALPVALILLIKSAD